MTEASPERAAQSAEIPAKKFEPQIDAGNFHDLLKDHLGKIFLIANPQSFEQTGLGHKITEGWYKAKLVGIGADYLIVVTEFSHGSGKKATKEPVRQYIPIQHIKRISLMRSERLIHI